MRWAQMWVDFYRKLAKVVSKTFNPLYLTIFILILGGCFFIPHPDVPVREGRDIVFGWAIIGLIALSLRNRWLGLFLAWTVVTTALNYDKYSYYTMVTVTIFLVVYDIMGRVIKKKTINFWLNCVCLAGLAQVPLCIVQFMNKDPIFEQSKYIVGFLDHETLLSAFLAFTAPTFFRKKWLWGLAFIIPIIAYNNSMMGLISLFSATSLYFLVKLRSQAIQPLLIVFLLIAISVSYFEPDNSSLKPLTWHWVKAQITGRTSFWPNTYEMNTESVSRSLLGYGPGRFKVVYNDRYRRDSIEVFQEGCPRYLFQAHSDPLQLWSEWGLIGLIPIIGFLIYLARIFLRNKEALLLPTCGLVAVIMNSFGNFPFHIPPLAFIGLFYAKLIEVKGYNPGTVETTGNTVVVGTGTTFTKTMKGKFT